MDHEKQFASAGIDNDNTVENTTIATTEKKKNGGFRFFKSAMLILCSSSSSSSSNNKKSENQLPPFDAANLNAAAPLSTHRWQNIVGSMRPLTLQEEDGCPRQRLRYYHPQHMRSSPSMDSLEDAMAPPYSPSRRSLSSSDTMSQYASAHNLCAMDEHNGQGPDKDVVFDNEPADVMIDVKAEQFIANFHAQMRSQSSD